MVTVLKWFLWKVEKGFSVDGLDACAERWLKMMRSVGGRSTNRLPDKIA
jgi:hypothetical protein